jgi:methionyl-tRNA formyltransferase
MARLAFFGTPVFSLPSLKAVHRFCIDYGHELSVVVSQIDQPAGRGQKLLPPPVKSLAEVFGIPVWQPRTWKKGTTDGEEFFRQFSHLNIDLVIVVAYGKILSERLLRESKRGFVNVHASLLPRFRGAAPVQRAIEAGDHETGVCLMEIVKELDEGDIYATARTPILAFDTSQSLFRRLASLGSHLLYSHLGRLLDGTLNKVPQSGEGVIYAHMVKKEEGIINFCEPLSLISHKVHAFDSFPGSWGYLRGKRVKFFDSFFIEDAQVKPDKPFGTIVVVGSFLGVKGKDGIVYFQCMQVEGKRAMSIREATLGFPIDVGERILETP